MADNIEAVGIPHPASERQGVVNAALNRVINSLISFLSRGEGISESARRSQEKWDYEYGSYSD